jgi:tetratricopeptide (TPR) repeat protein
MKRFWGCYFLIFFITSACYCQSEGDSLLTALKARKQQDTIKVILLNQLAYRFYVSDPSVALRFGYQAKKLADSLNYQRGVSQAYRQLGLISWVQSNLPMALNYFLKSLRIAEAIHDKQIEADAIGNAGLVYSGMGEYKKAMTYHTLSLKLQRKLKNKIRESVALNNIGDVYRFQKDFKKALQYYQQALDIRIQQNSFVAQNTNIRNIGNVYEEMGEYSKAIAYYQKSLPVSIKANDKRGESTCYNAMASTHLKQKKYKEARHYANASLGISLKEKFRSFSRDSYLTLSQISEAEKHWDESLKEFKLYEAYKDSVQNLKVASEISFQQSEFDSEKKQHEIDLLKKDATVNQLHLEKKNTLLIMTVLLLSVIVLLFLILYKSYARQKNINILLEEKNIKINQQRNELAALNEEISAQQEEVLTQRDSLAQKNSEIEIMHQQVVTTNQNLERIVEERTNSLEKQNEQLIEYAFINAHKLRAPLASIMGLVNILRMKPYDKEQEDILKHLATSSKQLDDVIRSINKSIEKGLDVYNPDNEKN